MTKTRKNLLSFLIGVGVVAVVLALALHFRKAAAPEAAVADDGFDLDAHLRRVRTWDPAKGFDQEAHEAALRQVGPPHQEALRATARAHAALHARERALTDEGAAGAALAEAIRGLREQASALRAPAPDAAAGGDAPAGADALQAQLAAKEAELKRLFEEDAEWRALRSAYETEDAKRKTAAARLQAVIRARMQAEHEIARMKEAAGSGPQARKKDDAQADGKPPEKEAQP